MLINAMMSSSNRVRILRNSHACARARSVRVLDRVHAWGDGLGYNMNGMGMPLTSCRTNLVPVRIYDIHACAAYVRIIIE